MARLAVALCLLPLLAACHEQYRYKMTAEVVHSGGVRRYSTVRQVDASSFLMVSAPNAPGMDRKLTGEALVMDLPGGATVFALLENGDYRRQWPEDLAFPKSKRRGESGMAAVASRASLAGAFPLPRFSPVSDGRRLENWPTLVRLRDGNDPATVVEVDPDDLPGGGRIRRITIAITHEPVMDTVKKRLPWLERYRNMSFAGTRYREDDKLPSRLAAGSFTTQLDR